MEIADLQANGKLDSEAAYQRLLNELHDLEGQNFVTYSDGVLDVNEEMLGKMLEQQGDEVDSSKPIWGALGDMIIEGHSYVCFGWGTPAAGGYLSLFVRLTGPTYRIRSRSYVVFLLLPVHFRRGCCPLLWS